MKKINPTLPIANPIREINQIDGFNDNFLKELHKGVYVGGDNVNILEKQLKQFLGTKYVLTTNSGTDSLFLSMSQVTFSRGDEVLLPSFTFFATVEAVMHYGLTPVFVDVDIDNFTVDPQSFFDNVSDKTKAFIPVHLFGKSAFNKEIFEHCKENNITIIEDCAQAFGSAYENKLLGNFGDLGAFSFFPSKTLGGIGDGGCIITSDKDIYKNLKKLKNHGQSSPYIHEISGVNSRLDSLNAFALTKKLEIFSKTKSSGLKLYKKLNDKINNEFIQKPKFLEGEIPNYYSLKINNRDNFIKYMNKKNIATSIYYKVPLHMQPALKKYGFKKKSLSNTEFICENIVSIPFFAFMDKDEVELLIEAVNNY